MAQERIIATDETIDDIVKSEIDRLGNQADLNHIDVSKVTDMEILFQESTFNGNISEWDVSKVEHMNRMFAGSQFNGDISGWDVSKVQNMRSMFLLSKFNGDISQWNVRDDLAADSVFEKSPVSAHPSFGKLHFIAKADDESKSRNESPMRHFMVTAELLDKPPMLHPAAEKAYATFMPIARAMYPNESGAVQAARAWEAYQSSLSTSDSYDYTSALFAFDPSNN